MHYKASSKDFSIKEDPNMLCRRRQNIYSAVKQSRSRSFTHALPPHGHSKYPHSRTPAVSSLSSDIFTTHRTCSFSARTLNAALFTLRRVGKFLSRLSYYFKLRTTNSILLRGKVFVVKNMKHIQRVTAFCK